MSGADGICTGLMFTCSGDVKPAITAWNKKRKVAVSEDREFAFKLGDISIPVNKRKRSYLYNDEEDVKRNNFKYVHGAIVQNYIAECFEQDADYSASFSENYETVDVTLHYLDLRNDNAIYTSTEKKMEFRRTTNITVPIKTNYDDTYMYPFILEEVPIKITNRFMSTKFGELERQEINGGYGNGIRVLMPLFNGGEPRRFKFTVDGVEYDAYEVDWYYLPNHRVSDGDEFFWWADWHKALPIHPGIDAREAQTMWSLIIDDGNKIQSTPESNGVVNTRFDGSCAIDKNNNIFLSAAFDSGRIKVSKLIIDGEELEILTDSETDAWYPIAPI